VEERYLEQALGVLKSSFSIATEGLAFSPAAVSTLDEKKEAPVHKVPSPITSIIVLLSLSFFCFFTIPQICLHDYLSCAVILRFMVSVLLRAYFARSLPLHFILSLTSISLHSFCHQFGIYHPVVHSHSLLTDL
jgi:hypothetical protein